MTEIVKMIPILTFLTSILILATLWVIEVKIKKNRDILDWWFEFAGSRIQTLEEPVVLVSLSLGNPPLTKTQVVDELHDRTRKESGPKGSNGPSREEIRQVLVELGDLFSTWNESETVAFVRVIRKPKGD